MKILSLTLAAAILALTSAAHAGPAAPSAVPQCYGASDVDQFTPYVLTLDQSTAAAVANFVRDLTANGLVTVVDQYDFDPAYTLVMSVDTSKVAIAAVVGGPTFAEAVNSAVANQVVQVRAKHGIPANQAHLQCVYTADALPRAGGMTGR